jgi:NAD(P)-dependent dehydrogenase (short-subunit alcohol dehydrogenase family)
MNTDGKRVLITGASGGLGTATMAALVEKGCKVVGIDKVASAQFKGDTIVVDLMDERQTEDAVAAAIECLGGLDVLINNAGVLDLQDPGLRPTAGVREHLEINLLAPWRVTAAALPALIKSHGRVVNVSSLVAVVGSAYHPAYCSSKRALIAYSDVLRMQYADRITVTCVYPGYMATPIHRKVEPPRPVRGEAGVVWIGQTHTSELGGTARRRGTKHGSGLFRSSGSQSVPDVPWDAFTPCRLLRAGGDRLVDALADRKPRPCRNAGDAQHVA